LSLTPQGGRHSGRQSAGNADRTARHMQRANVPRQANSTRSGERTAREVALLGILAVVLDVRKAGHSFRQMGQALVVADPDNMRVLGYSATKVPSGSTCLRWTQTAMEEARLRWREQADDTRAILEERLDEVVRANWANMQAGDVAAGRLILATEDRRAKLLGLDKREDKTDLADAIAELVRARVGQDGKLTPALPSPGQADVVEAEFTETEPSRTPREEPSPDDPRA